MMRFLLIIFVLALPQPATSFMVKYRPATGIQLKSQRSITQSVLLNLSESPKESSDIGLARSKEISVDISSTGPDNSNVKDENEDVGENEEEEQGKAATNTVNERLLAELEEATYKEKYGARSKVGRKMGLVDGFGRPRKTDEEIEAAIAKARDLNGVNPVVALMGSLFALATAAGLWYATQQLGTFFALHPIETDVYFVIRTTQVVRNVAMGLISLASGFFGVTGLGIFLLGVRVAFGVATGELDPTPIKQNKVEQLEMPNVWDLMLNKKPGRRGGGGDDNTFGI